MKLDDNYSVDYDGMQYVLSFEKEGEINPKTGKPIIRKDQWYPSTLGQALSLFMDKKLKDEETVDGAIVTLTKMLKDVKDLKFDFGK